MHISKFRFGEKTISQYIEAGHRRLVVLRGDMPSGVPVNSDFKYAKDLVKFIYDEFRESIFIDVAAYPECHPESLNFFDDLKYFKEKIEAGANRAITQYFLIVILIIGLLTTAES